MYYLLLGNHAPAYHLAWSSPALVLRGHKPSQLTLGNEIAASSDQRPCSQGNDPPKNRESAKATATENKKEIVAQHTTK